MIEKNTPMRDAAYLKWVRQQPSVISGQDGCEAHHPIGQRFSQSKCSDYAAFPVTTVEHADLHRGPGGWKGWEDRHGNQWMFATRTLLRAIADGFPFPRNEAQAPRKQSKPAHTGTALSSHKVLRNPQATARREA